MLDRGGPTIRPRPCSSRGPRSPSLLSVLGFNLLGDGCGDVLDPKDDLRRWPRALARAARSRRSPSRRVSPVERAESPRGAHTTNVRSAAASSATRRLRSRVSRPLGRVRHRHTAARRALVCGLVDYDAQGDSAPTSRSGGGLSRRQRRTRLPPPRRAHARWERAHGGTTFKRTASAPLEPATPCPIVTSLLD